MDRILHGDALSSLRMFPSQCVQTCVTSPPYFGLRDYGVSGQIGLEETPEAFARKLVEIFREVRRVLRDDGTLWLNLGDSYAGSWGNYGGQNRGNGTQREIKNGSKAHQPSYDGLEKFKPATANKHPILKPKDLLGIPWRVAFALQADGWYLRQDIIWRKPNPMPESVTDRCTKAHEYIFLLSKSERYYFDHEAIKEACTDASIRQIGRPGSAFASGRKHAKSDGPYSGKPWSPKQGGGGNGFKKHSGNTLADGTTYTKRNKRSVWTVATKPYKGAHFATFPPDLIKPCILAGAPPGYTVLDPFLGSGTTAAVAKQLGRRYLGIELNPEYIKLAEARLQRTLPPQPTLTEAA